MNQSDDSEIDDKLAELGRMSSAIAPRPGFNAKVMLAISAQSPGVWSEMLASSRWVIGAGLLAALLSVGWAVRAESSANEALAAAYEQAELPW